MDDSGIAPVPGTLLFTGYMYDDIFGTYFPQTAYKRKLLKEALTA